MIAKKENSRREWCELTADRKLLRDSHLKINKKRYPWVWALAITLEFGNNNGNGRSGCFFFEAGFAVAPLIWRVNWNFGDVNCAFIRRRRTPRECVNWNSQMEASDYVSAGRTPHECVNWIFKDHVWETRFIGRTPRECVNWNYRRVGRVPWVAPCMGARIEIQSSKWQRLKKSLSHSIWVRESKCAVLECIFPTIKSHPS